MKTLTFQRAGLIALLLTTLSACAGAPAPAPVAAPAAPQWQLVWSDEFNGTDGTLPDPARWNFDLGGDGWGNNELESYTARAVNAQQKGGNLVVSLLKEDFTGADGRARNYTSARLKTKGLFATAYGRFEARMQLPTGKGVWPAFWMLGDTIDTVGWPKAGEIDIMENIGDAATIYSTLHGPGYSGAGGISAKFPLPAGQAVNTAFHIYSAEWTPNEIKFYFDGNLIADRTPADLPTGSAWVFDHPFFLILDLAVGGGFPGNPDATTVFPQQMLVDYVRVYQKASKPAEKSAAPTH